MPAGSWLAHLALVWSALLGSPALEDGERATTWGTRAEIARLEGQEVEMLETSGPDPGAVRYAIRDIAGRGAPWIGVVRAQASDFFLETGDGARVRLLGPLARARITGPDYKVWVVGQVRDNGTALLVERVGVLAAPSTR